MDRKMNICVLFGGQSPEHEVSCRSAVSVIENLDKRKYNITTIGITKDGEWFLYTGGWDKIFSGEWRQDAGNLKKAIISPDAKEKAILVFEDDTFKKIIPDVVFPVLHGQYGEDGTIQGLLELANMKYVGTGVLASAVGMDKAYAKIIFKNAGIPQANWIVVQTFQFENMDKIVDEAEKEIGYPCFVKPANTGSSVGIGKAKNRSELIAALENASKFDRKILIEENIEGREVECSVLGNEHPRAAEIGEIIPTTEFYDYDAKYKDNSTKLEIPAVLDEEIKEKIREYSVRAFRAIDGMGLTRVDFFVKNKDNSIILNEVNTMPGFTSISMYPKLWEAAGLKYSDLLDELIGLALHRKK
ncbi:MAG: D-alanine--D-alanine ligase [Clostridia bacterium]|nr:D-alanine--D-alanine ligase [Clostridia bacterium]